MIKIIDHLKVGLWTFDKQKKSLSTLLYYLKQFLKVYLPGDNHQEIDNLADKMIRTFQCLSNKKNDTTKEKTVPFI
ncbi:hypothetical protein DFH28DRAFT_964617, partial [Melampsora americana]